ncbi:Nucleoside diphosphate kinase 6 [Amphibalanus amphitrite]|uniref:Nucleoside diphosphate kinase n=2 Tax=Amphibalanus amphitrite TaxID=1232801 RepID=A0A6A4WIQ7_AMPAM|nr:Nucleoside diphosphate kinase 6 [Amphibalanus amphitrite]
MHSLQAIISAWLGPSVAMSVPAPLQLTLALIKPDISAAPTLVRAVFARLSAAEFRVVRSRRLTLSRPSAEALYAEHAGRFFHNRLVTFVSSGPLWALVLARPDAIAAWRGLMGPTKVYRAVYSHPESLRAVYGLTDTRNGLHGSDSPQSAAREIEFFFPEFDAEGWLERERAAVEQREVVEQAASDVTGQVMTSRTE